MLPILQRIFDDWPIAAPLLASLAVVLSLGSVVAILLDRRLRSQSAMSWVLLVIVAPLVGSLTYLVFGKAWLSRKRARAYEAVDAERREMRLREEAAGASAARRSARESVLHALEPSQRLLAVQSASIAGDFPAGGNSIDIFEGADELFERLAADIDTATQHVHLEYYIALDDATSGRVLAALERAASRGVTCRVLLDDVGSRGFLRSARAGSLRASGVQLIEALPVGAFRRGLSRIDLRNHRKLVVIDRVIGYIGSHNLAARDFKVRERFAPWIDATMRVVGPAVNDLQKIFLEDWYLETDEPLPNLIGTSVMDMHEPAIAQVIGTGPATYDSAMPQLILSLVHLAEREVVLTTPYFVPDEPALSALLTAARRGVRTVLVVPESSDSLVVTLASRKFFQRLMDAGVEIWLYRGGLLHAKTIVADGATCMMTSANLDRRSFELNLEASLVVYDAATSRRLREVQERYLARSTRLDPVVWHARPAWERLIENAVGLLSPLL